MLKSFKSKQQPMKAKVLSTIPSKATRKPKSPLTKNTKSKCLVVNCQETESIEYWQQVLAGLRHVFQWLKTDDEAKSDAVRSIIVRTDGNMELELWSTEDTHPYEDSMLWELHDRAPPTKHEYEGEGADPRWHEAWAIFEYCVGTEIRLIFPGRSTREERQQMPVNNVFKCFHGDIVLTLHKDFCDRCDHLLSSRDSCFISGLPSLHDVKKPTFLMT